MNNKEIDVIESMLADDFEYVVPSTREQDWEGLKRVIAADTSGVPDAIFSIRRLVAEGDTVIAEYIWSGTHTGEYMGYPATNKRVTLPVVDIHEFEDGKVKLWIDYFNTIVLEQQLKE